MKHLNHPLSPCHSSFLEWPVENTMPPPLSVWTRNQDYSAAEQAEDEDSSATEDEDMPMEESDTPMEDSNDEDIYMEGPSSENVPKSFRKEYPGAARIVDPGSKQGQSFMYKFLQDEYAHLRTENLYYPFATSEEWQLASFLSRSPLSVAQTNEFLRLDLVRIFFISINTGSHSPCRSKKWASHLRPRKSFGAD